MHWNMNVNNIYSKFRFCKVEKLPENTEQSPTFQAYITGKEVDENMYLKCNCVYSDDIKLIAILMF